MEGNARDSLGTRNPFRFSLITDQECLQRLQDFIKREKSGLAVFYDEPALIAKAAVAANMVTQLLVEGCSKEIAKELIVLTLYDIVILIANYEVDDSSSMEVEQGGARIASLQEALKQITSIYDLANPEGILSVRFLNSDNGKKKINKAKSLTLLDRHVFKGVTRIGTELQRKVLDRFVWNPNHPMQKPLLVMIITDGAVEGERKGFLQEVIIDCLTRLKIDDRLKQDAFQAIAFHFFRVGNDKGAAKLLQELDSHKKIGALVTDNCKTAAHSAKTMSDPEYKWTVLSKLLLGAIVKDWDQQDEIVDYISDDPGEGEESSEEYP